jgi:hypothetical protein
VAERLRTSLPMLRELDDRRGEASSLAYLGAVALYRGQFAAARGLIEEATTSFGELEFKKGLAWTLNLLGLVEHREHQPARASELLQASLALHRELGDRWREASVLETLAAVACTLDEPDRAAWLLHQADRIRTTIGAPVPTIERPTIATTHAAIAAADFPSTPTVSA